MSTTPFNFFSFITSTLDSVDGAVAAKWNISEPTSGSLGTTMHYSVMTFVQLHPRKCFWNHETRILHLRNQLRLHFTDQTQTYSLKIHRWGVILTGSALSLLDNSFPSKWVRFVSRPPFQTSLRVKNFQPPLVHRKVIYWRILQPVRISDTVSAAGLLH